MTAKELIDELTRFDNEQEIILFDQNSIPYKIASVSVCADKSFNHIIIHQDAQ